MARLTKQERFPGGKPTTSRYAAKRNEKLQEVAVSSDPSPPPIRTRTSLPQQSAQRLVSPATGAKTLSGTVSRIEDGRYIFLNGKDGAIFVLWGLLSMHIDPTSIQVGDGVDCEVANELSNGRWRATRVIEVRTRHQGRV